MAEFLDLLSFYTLGVQVFVFHCAGILFTARGIQKIHQGYSLAGRLFFILAAYMFVSSFSVYYLADPYSVLCGIFAPLLLIIFWLHSSRRKKSQIALLLLGLISSILYVFGFLPIGAIIPVLVAETIIGIIIFVYGYTQTKLYAPVGITAAIVGQLIGYGIYTIAPETYGYFVSTCLTLSASYMITVAFFGSNRGIAYPGLWAVFIWCISVIVSVTFAAIFSPGIDAMQLFLSIHPLLWISCGLMAYGRVFARRYSNYGDAFSKNILYGVLLFLSALSTYVVYLVIVYIPEYEFIAETVYLRGLTVCFLVGYYLFSTAIHRLRKQSSIFFDIALFYFVALVIMFPLDLNYFQITNDIYEFIIFSLILVYAVLTQFELIRILAHSYLISKKKQEVQWLIISALLLILLSVVMWLPTTYGIIGNLFPVYGPLSILTAFIFLVASIKIQKIAKIE